MRVFLCGVDSGLGFAIAQRLLAEGHSVSAVTRFDVRSWKSSGVKAILGEIADPAAQRALTKADAVIDAELPRRSRQALPLVLNLPHYENPSSSASSFAAATGARRFGQTINRN